MRIERELLFTALFEVLGIILQRMIPFFKEWLAEADPDNCAEKFLISLRNQLDRES